MPSDQPQGTRLVSVPIDTAKLRREAEDPHVTIMASAQMIAAADEIDRLRFLLASISALEGREGMTDALFAKAALEIAHDR